LRRRRGRRRFLHAPLFVHLLRAEVLSDPDANSRVVKAEGQQGDDEAGEGEPRDVDLRASAW